MPTRVLPTPPSHKMPPPQRNSVHVWFVAHPRQLYDYSTGRPPTLYDISSSAHFYNKADAGIVVHRPSGASANSRCAAAVLLCSEPVHVHVRVGARCRLAKST